MVPLTPAWTELRYHRLQSVLWRTKARFVAVAAGRGSGKSEIARRRVVRMLNVKKDWPDPSYFYALPTYSQAKDKHWEKIKALVPRHWISRIMESRMVIETIYGSKLSLIGLDKAHRAEGEQYDGGVIDECFIAGTLVDTPCGSVPIEQVKVGDQVYCAAGIGTVTATKQRRKNAIAVVRYKGEDICCSLNHPFFTTRGWVIAQYLQPGDCLVETKAAMLLLQKPAPASSNEVLLQDMHREGYGAEEQEAADCSGAVRLLRGAVYSRDQETATCESLLRLLLCLEAQDVATGSERRYRGEGQPPMAFSQLEAPQTRACQGSPAQPDGRPRGQGEGLEDSPRYGASAVRARRQRSANAGATTAFAEAPRQAVGCGAQDHDRSHQAAGQAVSLHHRYCLRRDDDCGRGRRAESPLNKEAGREEGPIPEATRVESVEIHESGSPGFDLYGRGEDQIVLYDLTVDRHPSFSVNGVLVHNSSDVKPKTYDLTFVPAMTHRDAWCWRIGVPKRYGIGAREFHSVCMDWGNRGTEFASFTWKTGDILPPEVMAQRMETMDARDYNEQFEASWETASGVVYYAFDQAESLCTWNYRPDLPIFVGSDFNVDPMAWVLLQAQGQTMFAFDEIWLKNTNTQRTLDELARRYGMHRGGWRFFGDASGRSRKTSAASTDYMQILNDKRFMDAKVWYRDANPPIADRHAAVNWALKAASGKRTLFVDGRCLHLINDLKYLSYLEGSREVDDRDPEAGHITDALGYVIHYVKPMRLDGPVPVPQVMTM